MLKNGIFCKMVTLVVFKAFLVVKNLEILIKIVPDVSIYSYSSNFMIILLFLVILNNQKEYNIQAKILVLKPFFINKKKFHLFDHNLNKKNFSTQEIMSAWNKRRTLMKS